MATKLTPLEALQKRKQDLKKNPCTDKRKAKGKNQYTAVVISCFEAIEELLAKGDTYSGIFRYLQNQGFFEADADVPPFWTAFHRELRRRSPVAVATMTNVTSQNPVATHTKIPIMKIPSAKGGVIEGTEYERNGKRFTVLKGIEREVPNGYHVLRGAIVPKLVIEEPDDEDEFLDSSKLPDYIKKSMETSMSNGTVIDDAEKHAQMVAEWKTRRKQEKRKG